MASDSEPTTGDAESVVEEKAGATRPKKAKKKALPALNRPLRVLVFALYAAFLLLGTNGAYLSAVRVAESITGQIYQDYFYQFMFLGHLVVGVLVSLPFLYFSIAHWRRTRDRKVRKTVNSGYILVGASAALVLSGLLLTRLGSLDLVRSESARTLLFAIHVITPFAVIGGFAAHRTIGPKLKVRVGVRVLAVCLPVVAALAFFQFQDPRSWNAVGPESGEKYFFPSLARTSTGNFIPADVLMDDEYCRECHADIHESFMHSAHKFSSFNNPFYRFSVRGTREAMLARDGNVKGSRFCAGCHDPVPFFSGAFDKPNFDDEKDPTAHAGITCTTCHSIVAVNSPRGNADYTIEEPVHYPFARSDNAVLRWVNRALVKAKPDLHKRTFLKPLHKTTEFCGTCHKVHLPKELNDYKFLKGQNHYDSFLLSGVSGHGVASFYYPPKAEKNCNDCHMPLTESDDFGAKYLDDSRKLKVHDHQFPSANTGLTHVLNWPKQYTEKHQKFLQDITRLDIFGIREGSNLDGKLIAPLRPSVPKLVAGRDYVVDVVIRTTKMGHHLTQGTADSNELWLDVGASLNGGVIGRSGGRDSSGAVDPWTHFVNALVLDRNANRIDRRNAEDIFTVLYNNQIPPGAADVAHYRLTVPPDATGKLTFEVGLQYRKFDTVYMKHVFGEDRVNDLPTTTMATDRLTFEVVAEPGEPAKVEPSPIPEWQRWNDYGIANLRRFRDPKDDSPVYTAVYAFEQVERLGHADGPLNATLAHLRLRFVPDAVASLERAAAMNDPGVRPWRLPYLTGKVNMTAGHFEKAAENFESLLELSPELREQGFDFSLDYRLLADIAEAKYEQTKVLRGKVNEAKRNQVLQEAKGYLERALKVDPENVRAHHLIAFVLERLGEAEEAKKHRALRDEYKVDEQAESRVSTRYRAAHPAADTLAQNSVVLDLHRQGAFELPPAAMRSERDEPVEGDDAPAVVEGAASGKNVED